MASSLHFYATPKDLHDLLEFIYEETDMQVFEAYSRPNHELRCFRSLEEFDRGDPAQAGQRTLLLDLFSPSVTSGPKIQRYELSEKAGGGYRFCTDDPSHIRIVEGAIRNDIQGAPLDWTRLAHWSEKGAYQRSSHGNDILDTINWKELERLSRRIQYHIKKRLAVARISSRPILGDTYELMKDGLKLWHGPGLLGIDSQLIQIL